MKDEARARSEATCAARAVEASPDPEAAYGPGAVELVGAAPLDPDVSGDGRYVAWSSFASNLVSGDEGGQRDAFVWDRTTGTVTSLTHGADSASFNPDLSADGMVVTFSSYATDLVPDDVNRRGDVFRLDRATGTLARLTDGNLDSATPRVSADGAAVVFQSNATDLVPGDDDGRSDVYLWTAEEP